MNHLDTFNFEEPTKIKLTQKELVELIHQSQMNGMNVGVSLLSNLMKGSKLNLESMVVDKELSDFKRKTLVKFK